jgi:hypothetical protein
MILGDMMRLMGGVFVEHCRLKAKVAAAEKQNADIQRQKAEKIIADAEKQMITADQRIADAEKRRIAAEQERAELEKYIADAHQEHAKVLQKRAALQIRLIHLRQSPQVRALWRQISPRGIPEDVYEFEQKMRRLEEEVQQQEAAAPIAAASEESVSPGA